MDTDTLAQLGTSRQHSPIRLFARLYGMCSRRGFYFATIEEFNTHACQVRDRWWGKHVEFNIVFVDGDDLDADLFKALRINQRNLDKFFNATNDWSNREKTDALISATERGNNFEDIEDAIVFCRAMEWERAQNHYFAETQEFYP